MTEQRAEAAGLATAAVSGRERPIGVQLEPWRRLPFERTTAASLLAGAEALLDGLAGTPGPVLRWSVAQYPALLLGSSQRPTEVDFAACEAAGSTVHRRRSGGTAVLVDDGMLWLDVALPSGHRLLPTDITEAYRWFGEVWATALGSLGVDCRPMPQVEARTLNAALDPAVQHACYGGVSPYEVFVGERKLVGLAQVRRRQGGLLQAGMYARWEGQRLADLLRGSLEEKTELGRLLKTRAVGLHDLIALPIPFDDVIVAWEGALADRFGVELTPAAPLPAELTATQAAEPRYAPLTAPPHDPIQTPDSPEVVL